MEYQEVYFDAAGRVAVNRITNAPEEFVPRHIRAANDGEHLCWIAYVAGGYQCRCSCGKRFGVHVYPMAQSGAQRDVQAHRINFEGCEIYLPEIDGVDYKLRQLAWE